MKYAVVIVTYNRLEKLKKCIKKVENQIIKASHIIIVDNASSDGTNEYLKNEKFHSSEYIIKEFTENRGGSGGFYAGMKEALNYSDDWILLIDDDAMLREDYMLKISGNIVEGILAYTGSVNEHNKISMEHRRNVKLTGLYKELPVGVKALHDATFDFDLASFCGLLVNIELVKKIGLPKEDFFIWYDDTEYSLRIRKYSKIRNVNTAILDHELSSYKSNIKDNHQMNWKVYYGLRNRLYTIRQYGNTISVFKEILVLSLRLAKYRLWAISIKPEKKMIGEKNFIILKNAIKDGLRGKLGKNVKFLP